MIWARAVWIENYEEIEDVVPRKWIDTEKKLLFWPAGVSYRRAVKEEMDVDETWNKYKLIKIKFESDNMEELKEYCYTTAAEEEDVVDICVSKSAFKLKKLPDFPLPPPVFKSVEKNPLKRSFDFSLSPGSTSFKQSNLCSLSDTFLPQHSITEEQSTSYSGTLFLSPESQESKKKLLKTDVQKTALVPEKLVKNQFPMEVGKYQHMIFKMLSKGFEKQELILALNKQSQSNIAIKQLETIAEFEDFNKSLVDDCVRLDLVKQLSFLCAEDFKQLTRLVMNRLFTNTLLTQFNLKGSGGKIGLHSTKLYDVIEEVVKRRFEKVSNAEIKEQIGRFCKNAPSREKNK
nr:uncharacterized protein LOC124818600 [Hydra vulgaris]